MTPRASMYGGMLCLLCGIFLLVQSAGRLRADPTAFPVCPNKDISSATNDCAVATPCEGDSGGNDSCTADKTHWEVVAFPVECLEAGGQMCSSVSSKCQIFILCEYKNSKCTKAAVQPGNLGWMEKLKLVGAACP